MNNEDFWNRGTPPLTKVKSGEGSIVWYEVLYDDGEVGQSCWWYDHWYCNDNWTGIVGWKEIKK